MLRGSVQESEVVVFSCNWVKKREELIRKTLDGASSDVSDMFIAIGLILRSFMELMALLELRRLWCRDQDSDKQGKITANPNHSSTTLAIARIRWLLVRRVSNLCALSFWPVSNKGKLSFPTLLNSYVTLDPERISPYPGGHVLINTNLSQDLWTKTIATLPEDTFAEIRSFPSASALVYGSISGFRMPSKS